MPSSIDDQPLSGVDPETYFRLKDKVVNLAKTIWNADPKHFVDWATLTFQAYHNEGDARQQRNVALRDAYESLLQEEELEKAERARQAAETQEVWKYQFDVMRGKDVQEFEMPKGSKILTVKEFITYDNRLVINIWALGNPEADKTTRQIQIVGTGHPVPKEAIYLGTAFYGSVVLHVWETHKP